jgi:hypothetical protein
MKLLEFLNHYICIFFHEVVSNIPIQKYSQDVRLKFSYFITLEMLYFK